MRIQLSHLSFCENDPPLREPSLDVALARRAFADKRLLDARRSFLVGRFKPVKQPIGTGFEELRKARERRHGKWKTAVFNCADGLHMDACQLRKTFLRQAGVESRMANISPQHTQDFAVVHPLRRAYTLPLLTPDNH